MAQFIEFDAKKQPRCKVELHAHMDGAVRITTIWDIAQRKGYDLKVKTLEEFFKICRVKTPSTLKAYLKHFNHFIPVIRGDGDAIERIAYEFCEDVAAQGVLYSEARYCPHFLTFWDLPNNDGRALTPRDVVQRVNKGLHRGGRDFEITIRSILCCSRPYPEWSEDMVHLCDEFKDEGVVGIDVIGVESAGLENQQIIDAFKLAASLGIHRTAHAGEAGLASNVKIALDDMLAERIGHGYHVVDDPELYKHCLDNRIHFETCPHSSFLTGSVPLSTVKHPIVRFAEDGANFSISCDDPTLIQKNLDQEYELLRNYGLKNVHFTRANFNAARNCFLPKNEKKDLLLKLSKIYSVDNITAELAELK